MVEKKEPQVICLDFDGTCVTHEFPKVGRDIGATPVLFELLDNGHQFVLNTMRSDMDNPKGEDKFIHYENGKFLTDALNWFKQHEIPLYGIHTNPSQKTWTESPKAYGQLYIDDAALGCPLIHEEGSRPYVDWVKVRQILIEMGFI